MLFDVVSPISSVADLLPVGSSLDAALTHRPQQEVVVLLHKLHFVRRLANAVGRSSEEFDFAKAVSPKRSAADIISRRNGLVQDRDAGSVWPALACAFLLVEQPCQR